MGEPPAVRGAPGGVAATRSPAWLLPCALALALCCEGCEREHDGPKVPFKLGAPRPTSAARDGAAPPAKPPPEPLAQSYTPPLDRPELDGAPLPLDIVRATLLVDVDDDGDRDALSLLDDAASRLRLVLSLRDAEGFAAASDVPGFRAPLEAGCAVEMARIDALSATKAIATVHGACAEPTAQARPGYVLFSLEPGPRVYERIQLLSPDREGLSLQLSAQSADTDGDGHDDVVLSFTLLGPSGPLSDPLAMTWFDRPSGLVRDVREPEATLSAWSSAAHGLLSKSPADASTRAQGVLRMRSALCREAGAPLLRTSDSPGIACGPVKSSAQAALALVAAYAQQGSVREAFAAYRSLTRSDPRPDSRTLDDAKAALRKLPAEPGITMHQGPAVETRRLAPVHLPLVRFVDEDTLLVRRRTPVLVRLTDGSESPAPASMHDDVRDPSGQLAVTDVERTCQGYVLRIERALPPGSEYAPSPPVSTPLVLPLASPPGCTILPEAERRNGGDFRVLGWAPQGVVLARGSELFVVPLNLDGKPQGEPRVLDPSVPVPAPLPSGVASPDGSRHVEAGLFGVLVHQASGNLTLWRPQGYEAVAQSVSDAAISPSGTKVAVVAGGRTYILSRPGAHRP